jgi:hypothetical protein
LEDAQQAIAEGFRDLERRRLGRTLLAAAHHARGDDYKQHFLNAGALIALAATRCVVTQEEAAQLRKEWCATEGELMLRTLPAALRRRLLLDPTPGSASFITPRRRLLMLREIDEAA